LGARRENLHICQKQAGVAPAPFSGFASFVPTGLDLSSSPYPELAPWALFFISLPLRSWVRGGAHEIGRPKQYPHVSRKERARSGAPAPFSGIGSFGPTGLVPHVSRLPSAYALGCILAPLRGWGSRRSARDWEIEAKIPTSRAKNAREVGHPHPSPVLFRSSLRDLCPMSLVYPALTRWAAFLRRFAAGVAAERTRLGDRGKNPHVSRKERARSGAPAVGWTSRVLGRSQAPPGENGSARDVAALGFIFIFSPLRSWVRGGAYAIGRSRQKSTRLAQKTREKWGTRRKDGAPSVYFSFKVSAGGPRLCGEEDSWMCSAGRREPVGNGCWLCGNRLLFRQCDE
jgi:hypothetical protein